MFEITIGANDEVILSGRFDATQVEKARAFFLPLSEGKVVDCKALESISSAGLGILLATQKRLSRNGEGLKLININGHLRDVLRYTGLEQIFQIE